MNIRDLFAKAGSTITETTEYTAQLMNLRQLAGDARALNLSELENRILLSASPAAVVAAPVVEQSADLLNPTTEDLTQVAAPADNASETPESTVSHELVFVDASAEDYRQLLDDLWSNSDPTRHLDVVLLSSNRDGLEQITETLAQYTETKLDAVHFVSHGNDGGVQLGNTWLNQATLDSNRTLVSAWSHSLKQEADLLFYGCDLASSDVGQSLLTDIAQTTGADIAASTDDTGAVLLGGDWELEHQIGDVDSEIVFTTQLQTSWLHTLDITSDLLLHNTFDADASDSSGNNYDGTLVNGAVIDPFVATANIGPGKVRLDGVNDYVNLSAHVSNFDNLSEGTIAVWFYADTTSGFDVIFEASDSGDIDSRLAIFRDGDEIGFFINEGSTTYMQGMTTTANYSAGAWNHVAITVDATGNKIYVNGVQRTVNYVNGSSSTNRFFDDVTQLDFMAWGVDRYNNTQYIDHFDGFLDDGRIYSRALSSSDISELINPPTHSVEGYIYEDIDGDGDILDDGALVAGATVHFYRDGGDGIADGADDVFVTSEVTDAGGQYLASFSDGTYWVVADSKSITPSASVAGADVDNIWAEQTYAGVGGVTYDGATYSYTAAAGALYGGVEADVSDSIADHTNALTLSTAEHINRVVVSGADVTNVDFGFSYSAITNTRDGGDDDGANDRTVQGSLRQFMQNAEAMAGIQSSYFAISNDDVNYDAFTNSYRIQVAGSVLPFLNDGQIVLDATMQNGYDGTPSVILDGSLLVGANQHGIHTDQSGVTVKGFVIQNFSGAGIYLGDGSNHVIQGNYIGTNVDGTLAAGNSDGIYLAGGADGAIIGGSGLGEGNLISGNSGMGIDVDGVLGTVIKGNLIGTDFTGTQDLGNSVDGIRIGGGASNTIVGGTTLADRNIISGNDNDGIWINGASGSIIQGNWIGVGSDGSDLGNLYHGIGIDTASNNNLIGGTTAGTGNRIAYNDWDGISLTGNSTGNTLLGNEITDNSGLAIDLEDDGITGNDESITPPVPQHDVDSGSNNLQNFPVLWVADVTGTNLHLVGSLKSAPNTQYRIEFYNNPLGTEDVTGNGEARVYLGSVTVTADANGEASIDTILNGVSVADGDRISATATEILNPAQVGIDDLTAYGATSEMSLNLPASAATAAPSDLTATSTSNGGLRVNADGGNDAYLVVESDGTAEGIGGVLGGLSSMSIELDFAFADGNRQTLLSYAAVEPEGNDFFIRVGESTGYGYVEVLMNGTANQIIAIAENYNFLLDGNRHQLAFTWDNASGDWSLYADGTLRESGTGFAVGETIAGDANTGTLMFGQEQDNTSGSGFQTSDTFRGTYYDVRIFDDVRTAGEIAASHRSDLPYDEPNMIANWKFDQLSTNGISLDTVSGNNLTVQHASGIGFTASEPKLTLELDENSPQGTIVGQVQGTDQAREDLIAALLADNPGLYYNAETHKFYRQSNGNPGFGAAINFATAVATAQSETLNGISGQLVTIRSASENAYVGQIISDGGGWSSWLGGTDQTTEGQWRWLDGSADNDVFWIGDETGFAPSEAFVNWIANDPANNAAGDDAITVTHFMEWNDTSVNSNFNYITEWDADDVLNATQQLTYSIVSQTVAGAFAIDGNSGTISVADGALLDYESTPTHAVTVRVTDVDANTYDQAFTISVNNLLESNSAPTDLSSGIELNTDGGNDAYLIASDGSAVLGNRTTITAEVSFASNDTTGFPPLYSYAAVDAGGNDFKAQIFHEGTWTGEFGFFVNGDVARSTAMDYRTLFDGVQHHVATSWNSTNGEWAIYIDGELIDSGTDLATGTTIATGGELLFGQEQDSVGGGFQEIETFSGTLYDIRMWDNVRSEAEISLNYQQKLDVTPVEATAMGLVANWQMDGFNGSNEVVDVVAGNNLSIGHATGTGFIASTPVEDLHVAENATTGTSVGYAVPSDPDAPQDIVSDGLFLEGANGRYVAGQSFGGWTVNSGTLVDLIAAGSGAWDETPLGGDLVHLWEPQSSTPNSIEQTLVTEVGRRYQVVFAASGNWESDSLPKTLRVSVDGESSDLIFSGPPTDWALNNLLWEQRSISFTASDTSTVLSFTDMSFGSNRGTLLADIQVVEIPVAVQTILNNDPSLTYNAATGKFYQFVQSASDWSTALNESTSATLNGVNGQLVTIRSAYENDVVRDVVAASGWTSTWLGANDTTSEGEFFWLNGTQDNDQFWTGGATGSATAYANFAPGEPYGDGNSTSEDYVYLNVSTGLWDDAVPSVSQGYVIEWDASEVLSSYTFSISDASNNFEINSSTGEITVAATSTLDYETATFHDVDVTVTDAAGNSYLETMRIQVDNVVEPITTVSATGSGTVEAGAVYTLNLSSDGEPTGWTINWGDGSIETIAGNPSTATHTYGTGLTGRTLDITVSATDGSNVVYSSSMLAPAYIGDRVHVLDGYDGTANGTFAPLTDGIDGPASIVVMPSGNYLVSGVDSGNILQYQPDGTYVGVFVTSSPGLGGLDSPGGLAYGPDGNLYVADYGDSEILRYDGATGAFIDVFVPNGTTGLSWPLGLTFGPDGSLYVASRGTEGVLKFDGTTGVKDTGFSAGPFTLAEDVTIGPDGNLYVASMASGVLQLDASTGATLGTFVSIGSGGLTSAAGIDFGPDGSLYVADQAADVIRRYNGTTGAYIDDYATGIDGPAYMDFTPDQQVTVTAPVAVPSVSQTLPGAQSTDEDTTITFSTANGNAITVDDGTAATDTRLQVWLGVQGFNGTLTLSQTTNLSFPGGSNGSSSMVIWGTEADINAALEGMIFTPNANYNGPADITVETKLAADLQGLYEFENGGNIGQDTSVGVLQSGASLGTANPDQPHIVTDGTRGNVLQLDGDDDSIEIAGTFLNPSNVSLSAWIKFSSTDTFGGEVISLGNAVILRVDDAAVGTTGVYWDGSQHVEVASGQSLADDDWHHVAFVFDDTNNSQTLYIDGVAASSANASASINYTTTGFTHSRIGAHVNDLDANFHFNGLIDDARIYTRALSAEEIASLAADAQTATGTVAITVQPVNDAPTISSLGGDFQSAINNGTPVSLDATILADISDADSSNFGGGSIQVTGNSFDVLDQIGINTSGSISLSTGLANGSVVSVSGVAIGTLSGVTNDGFTLSLNTNATVVRTEALLQQVTFASTSTVFGSRTVDLTLVDGDGTANGGMDTATVSVTINLASSNNGVVTTDEDSTYTYLSSDFDFTGVVGTDLREITIVSLPTNGVLELNSVAVTAGQTITKAQIDAGQFTYTPAPDENGSPYGTFNFYVNAGNQSLNILTGEPSSYNLNSSFLTNTDEILLNESNFGPSGTHSTKLQFESTSTTIDAAYLSQGEIYFGGYVSDGNLDAGELTAIDNWVNAGGVLISTNDAATYDSIAEHFGLVIGGSASSTWHVADVGNSIINGEFGSVGNVGDPLYAAGTISYFDSASLAVGDLIIATDSVSGEPTMVLRQHGDGWILFMSDEGPFRSGMTGGGVVSTPNDILAANIFAWAANAVAPAMQTMEVNITAVNDAPLFTDETTGYSRNTVPGTQVQVLVRDDGSYLTVGYDANDQVVVSYLADGTIDSSFGTNGVVITDIAGGRDRVSDAVMQADGKFILVGYDQDSDLMQITRYNADGSLDTSYGIGGTFSTNVAGAQFDWIHQAVIQPDGKLVVVGVSDFVSNDKFMVLRINTDGTFDNTFGGGDGIVTLGIAEGSGSGITLQPDGKIVAVGHAYIGGAQPFSPIVTRLNSDGSFDTTFNGTGVVQTPAAGSVLLKQTVVQADGKILAIGNRSVDGDIVIFRYNANGTLDTTYGGGTGYVTTAFLPGTQTSQEVLLQADGKLVISGVMNDPGFGANVQLLARFNTDGSLDTTFGEGDGYVAESLTGDGETVVDLKQLSDGTLVIGSQIGSDFSLSYYDAGGVNIILPTSLDFTATYVEDTAAILLDGSVRVSDAELDALNGGNGNYAGSSVTLSRNGGASTDDLFSFADGNGITLSGSSLIKNAVVIATFDTTTTAGELVITFTDANGEIPTSTDVDNILSQLTYANSNGSPPASVQIDWTFSDGDATTPLQATGSTTVSITSVNDAPVFQNLDGNPTFTEGGSPVLLDADVEVFDAELSAFDDFGNTTVILGRSSGPNNDDVFSGSGNLQFVGSSFGSIELSSVSIGSFVQLNGILQLTFNPGVTNAQVNTALQSITYENTSAAPPANVQILWVFDDENSGAQGSGGGEQVFGITTVNITGSNNAPNLTSTSLAAIDEDTVDPPGDTIANLFAGNFSDPDAGSSFAGVAIVTSPSSLDSGYWEYSTDAGTSWYDVGSVSSTTALMIDTSTMVRFVPAANFNGGVPQMNVRAIDDTYTGSFTSGASRVTANVQTNGGSTPYSGATASIGHTVNSIQDDPFASDNTVTLANSGVIGTTVNEFDFVSTWVSGNVSGPRSVAAGDIDGDGDIDLVAGGYGDLDWYQNDGTGNYTAIALPAFIGTAEFVTIADLNQDGHADILVTNLSSDEIIWYQNDGSENFTQQPLVTLDQVNHFEVVDLDGDGDLDIVAAEQGGQNVVWLENDGAENFTANVIQASVGNVRSVVVRDLDADGDLDVVYNTSTELRWLENDGAESFTSNFIGTHASVLGLGVEDFNGDGDLDVVAVTNASGGGILRWYENDGAESFTSHDITTLYAARNLITGDFDNDGDMDFVVAEYTTNQVKAYYNDGTGNFSELIVADNLGTSNWVAAGDLNGDGLTDFASNAGGSGPVVIEQRNDTVLVGDIDNDGDTLQNVTLVSGPTFASSFTLNTDGTFSYTHDGSNNLSDSFTYTVDDGTGRTSNVATVTITVTNASPVVTTNNGLTLAEEGTATITQAMLQVTDAESSASLITYTLTEDVANGTLRNNGTALGVGDTFTQQDINDGLLTYQDTGLETTADSFQFTVSDGAGGAISETTFSITVTPVNDAPSFLGMNPLNSIAEDDVTNSGTLVSQIVDTEVSDPDVGAVKGLAVYGVDNTNGTWEYTLDGTNWLTFGSPSLTSARLLAADATTAIRFVPNADYNGTSGSLLLLAWDQTSGAAGGTIDTTGQRGGSGSLSAGSASTYLTVTPVNDAPVATDNTYTAIYGLSEGGTLSSNAITFNTGAGVDSDVDGDSLEVTQVNGAAFTPGTPITLTSGAEVTFQTNGSFTYDTTDAFETLGFGDTTTDSFTYQISDGNGGFDTATVIVTINGLNDAPTINTNSLTISEGGTVVLSNTDINSSDPDHTASELTYTATIITAGQFELVSNPGVAITSFTQDDIDTGKVQFVHDGSENAPTYSLTISDGTLSDGPNAAVITFNSANDPPTLTMVAGGFTYNENATGVLVGTGSSVNDVDSPNFAGGQLTTTISNAGTADDRLTVLHEGTGAGQVEVSGTNIQIDGLLVGTFSGGTGHLDPLVITFTANAGAAEVQAVATRVNFSIVSDHPDNTQRTVEMVLTDGDGGTSTPDSVVVNVIQRNDTPVVNVPGANLSATEDVALSLISQGFTLSDPDAVTGTLRLTIGVDYGSLTATVGDSGVTISGSGGTSLTIDGTLAQLNNLLSGSTTATLQYQTTTDTPPAQATLSLSLNDNGNTGIDPGLTGDGTSEIGTNSILIDIAAVNDVPTQTTPASVSILEGDDVVLDAGTWSDAEGDTLTFAWDLDGDAAFDDASGASPTITWSQLESFNLGDDGTYTIAVQANDGNGGLTSGTMTLTITNVAPTANNDGGASYTTDEDTAFLTGNVLANDTDPSTADTLTVVSFDATGTIGQVINNGDGTFSYDPNGQFESLGVGETATDSFTYTITDDDGGTSTATVTITINGVNDAPVQDVIAIVTIAEGGSVVLSAGSWSDADGDALTYSWDLDGDTTYGDVIGASPTLTWAVLQSFGINDDGTYLLSVQANDSNGGVTNGVMSLTVTNTAPTANDDSGIGFITDEDTSAVIGNVLANDTDPADGDTPFMLGYTAATFGTVVSHGDGTFTYNPNGQFESLAAGETATDSFTYTIQDGDGGTSTATVTITINGVNDDPAADAGGPYTIAEGDSLTLDASLSTDAESQSITYNWDLDNDGVFDDATGVSPTLTWAQLQSLGINDNGTYPVGLQLIDSQGGVTISTTTLSVTNTPPVANDDAGASYTTDENTSFLTGNVLANDTDVANGDVLSVLSLDTTGALGTVTDNGDGTFTYDPNGQFESLAVGETATDTFSYTMTDGDGGTSTATVAITINGVNDAPVISTIADQTVDEDTTLGPLSFTVGDAESAAGTLVVSAFSSDQGLISDANITLGGTGSNRTITLTPEWNQNGGPATITIFVNDGSTTTQTTFNVTVNPVNDAPFQDGIAVLTIAEGDDITLDAGSWGDYDGGPLTYSWDIDGDGIYGDATGPSPTLTWAVLQSFGINDNGNYTLSIRADDGNTGIGYGIMALTVTNTAPVANDDDGVAYQTTEDAAIITIDVRGNDLDVAAGDVLSVVGLDTTGTVGQVVDNGDGTFTYDPNGQFESLNAGESVTDQFTYTLSDDDGGTDAAVVTITITGVDDAPIIVQNSLTIREGESVVLSTGDLNATDIDTTDETLTFTVQSVTNGQFEFVSAPGVAITGFTLGDVTNGDVQFVHDGGELAPTFGLTVSDATSTTLTSNATITYTNVNDAPVITSGNFVVAENITVVGPILSSDVDGGAPLLSVVGGADQALFTTTPGGELAFIALPDFDLPVDANGDNIYEVRVRIDDGNLGFDERDITVTVTDLNDTAPVIDPYQTMPVVENAANGTVLGTVIATDVDTIGTLQNWQITAGNDLGIFALDPATGELRILDNTNLDYEATTTHNLIIEVSDGAQVSAAETVVVQLIDQNEVPVDITLSGNVVTENAANLTVIGTLNGTDVDAGDTLLFTLLDDANGRFQVDTNTGILTVADGAQLNFEASTSHQIRVQVSDQGGLTYFEDFTINLTDLNEAPVLTAADFSVNEHTAVGTVVSTVSATDVDAGNSLTFRIASGNSGGVFAIDSLTGDITVANTSALVHESTPTVSLTIEVTDQDALADTRDITVSVVNVNDAPIAGPAAELSVRQIEVLTLPAPGLLAGSSDGDGDTITPVLVAGPVNGAFTLNPDGSWEYDPVDTFFGIETVTFYLTDGLEQSTLTTWTIEVTPAGPVVDAGPETPPENEDTPDDETNNKDDEETPPEEGVVPTLNKPEVSVGGPSNDPGPVATKPVADVEVIEVLPIVLKNDGEFDPRSLFHGTLQSAPLRDPDLASNWQSTTSEVRPESEETVISFIAESSFWNQIDSLHHDLQQSSEQHQIFETVVVGTTTAVTGGFTVGYVLWLIRGGSLVATMMSVMPTWATFDPLPVLDRFQDVQDEDQEDLVSLVVGNSH